MKNKQIVQYESEFSDWFKKNYRKLGFSKIVKQNISTSPDFVMLKGGKEIGVELETLASNFILHKHRLDKIDEVLCLVKDIELGLPIIVVTDLIFKPKYRRVTLSINDKVYAEFQNFCFENDIILSKRIERLMNEELELSNKNKRDKKT